MKKPIYIHLKKRAKNKVTSTISMSATEGAVNMDFNPLFQALGVEILDYDYIEVDGKRIDL